ncbi:UbiA prenyltransferase family protein [Candidatus Bathyarchaeota archaeon]|nr:UbiA prenyltransferase family protein [Candidatus Bathyarchaeota archaeon]
MKSRIEPIFAWPWGTLIACLIAGKGFPPIVNTFLAVFSTLFITASVYIYNDYIDTEMDRLNFKKKDRPLVTGEVSMGFAASFIAVTAALGLGMAYLINLNAFIWALAYFVLFFVYSYPAIRLKRVYVVKELTIMSVVPISSVIGSYAVLGTLSVPILYAGVTMGLFLFLMLPALNESFDVDEDKIYGVKTLAQTLSWRFRTQMIVLGIALMVVMTSAATIWFGFSVALPLVTAAASVLLLRVLATIWDSFDRDVAYSTRIKFQLYFFAIQIMFVLGSMNLAFFNFF